MVSDLNLKNLERNKTEILKVEVGALLFNLGKTHMGFWREKGKGQNKVVYFDIDEKEFEEKYRYKPFSGYKNYFEAIKDNKEGSKFNSKSPFVIDMNSIDEVLKDFFNETDINFQIENKDKKEINLQLIDVVKGDAGDSEFIKKIMFRGCENVNSGIDKGAPKKQLNNLEIANAFGAIKEEITNKEKSFADLKRYDETRIIFLMNLWRKICSLGEVNVDVYEMRKFILKEVEEWYSHLLSDSRFPINDVTLWDQAYMTASMFKASVAAICLEGKKYDDYIEKPRSIKWSILGVQYDKLGIAEKAINPAFIDWYRDETNRVDEKVKRVIEEDFALGNEVYRDETGIYFIVPENICGEKAGDDIGLYKLDKKLGNIQEKIIECFKSFNGEVFPAIFVTEPSRGTMNIAFLIENAKENFMKPIYPKSDLVREYFGEIDNKDEFKVVCDVCKVRLAEKNEEEDLNLCKICSERKKKNESTRLNDKYKETIWTGELQDKNRRLALVTMKFELDEWLNGNMLNTMLINTIESVNCNIWDKALEEIEILLKNISRFYIPLRKDEKNTNNNLEGYKEFGNDNFDKVDKFLLYFEDIIKNTHEKVFNKVFHGKEFNTNNKDFIDIFNSYIYSFLDSEKINLKDIVENEKARYNFEVFLKECKVDCKDWGSSPHTTAKGMFSFAYVTEQIKSIIFERTIGDEWEELLKNKLKNKIDFESRKIEWDELSEEEIELLSYMLLQFLIRKNPSPARFRRIWETTEEFFIDIENNMMDILEIPEWRNIRIKWNKDKFQILESQHSQGGEFGYQGLDFILDEGGNLYLISSIEKAVPILSKESVNSEEKLQEIYRKILDCEGNWMKKEIELVNKADESTCRIQFKPNKKGCLKLENISYRPYLSIINPTPISWQFIVPAQYVPNLIEKVQHKYDEEFKYVKGKLPLHIGVVFQDYKNPLYIGIKALRNIRRDIDSWDSIEKEISGEELKEMVGDAINNSNSGCENRTELKRYYSLYPLNDDNKGDYSFYVQPNKDPVEFKSIDKAKKDEKYIIYPNTIDFEYLDVNTRRNDIYYDSEKGNRNKVVVEYKQNRPYTWQEWKAFDKFYKYFNDKERKTKLQTMTSLIYSKLNDWKDDESIKSFMLSAFVNTFELNDDKSKDDFARIFDEDTWDDMKSMNGEIFKRELYKFLDMYDFWHDGLKRI